jgi:hypothetical protein
MGSVSPKMEGTPIDEVPIDDEEDMTSVMSSDQRKALQKAAKTEKDSATLERDTARPPPSEEHPVSIPRAAPIPAEARTSEEVGLVARHEPAPRVDATPAKPQPAAPAPARKTEAPPGWATWELVAFLLLAASVAAALRM